MLINFFNSLRNMNLPTSLKEFLDLLEALEKGVVFGSLDDFYFLSRSILIKDEKYYDKYDLVFSAYFKELADLNKLLEATIPDDWLRATFLKNLTEEEKAQIQKMKNLQELLDKFKERLKEQTERHSGGNKWVGTGGTSPFGNSGYHPEGIRIGGESMHKSAVKVWDKREFKNFDTDVEIGTRNIKLALRNLRQFARTGNEEELDLDSTIKATANNAGFLDLKMQKEKHNAVKVLLFLDVGGSMDSHIQTVAELFSACKTEFKHLEYFYFHNCVYEALWRDNSRRFSEKTSTEDILRTYGKDYKVIFVGDASMAPWEISEIGGSVEHYNNQTGAYWLNRVKERWSNIVWLNPIDDRYWQFTASIRMIDKLMESKMYPLTLSGLNSAIEALS